MLPTIKLYVAIFSADLDREVLPLRTFTLCSFIWTCKVPTYSQSHPHSILKTIFFVSNTGSGGFLTVNNFPNVVTSSTQSTQTRLLIPNFFRHTTHVRDDYTASHLRFLLIRDPNVTDTIFHEFVWLAISLEVTENVINFRI